MCVCVCVCVCVEDRSGSKRNLLSWWNGCLKGRELLLACCLSSFLPLSLFSSLFFIIQNSITIRHTITFYVANECSVTVNVPFWFKAACKPMLVSNDPKHSSQTPVYLPLCAYFIKTMPINFQHCNTQKNLVVFP